MEAHSTRIARGSTNGNSHDQIATNIVLRPVANPLPLGLFAMAAGAFIVAVAQLGWLPVHELSGVGWLLFAFAVPLSAVAGLFAMISRDTIAGTVLGIVAGTLAGYALAYVGGTPLSAVGATHLFGWFLFASAGAMALTALGSALDRPVFAAAMVAFGAWSVATAIFEIGGSGHWSTIAGIVGLIATGVAACAAAASVLVEERIQSDEVATTPRVLLDAIQSGNGFASVVPGVEHEPGVRAKL